MLTSDQIRRLPDKRFAFATASGREIKGGYEPSEDQPDTLVLAILAKLPNGEPYPIARTYPVGAKLSIAELEAEGESLDTEAHKIEQFG